MLAESPAVVLADGGDVGCVVGQGRGDVLAASGARLELDTAGRVGIR